MDEKQQCCYIGISTLIVAICISMLGYACWYARYTTMPHIRYQVFCDRIAYNTQSSLLVTSHDSTHLCTNDEEAHNAEETSSTGDLYVIYCLKTNSYPYAVQCSCHLREQYGLWCDIIRRDTTNEQKDNVCYTLVTPPMTSDVCDNIVTMLKNNGTMRYIHKARIT